MPESTVPATELTSQYVNQVTGDLEQNVKEQERVTAEIAGLQEQLATLQRDHAILVSMRQALGVAASVGTVAEPESPVVPSPRKKSAPEAGKRRAGRTATAEKTGAKKPEPPKPAATKPEPPKPAATKPEPPKPAATKPAAKKSEPAKAETTHAQTKKAGPAKAGAGTGAAKKAVAKPAAKKTATKAAQPTLVELVRGHLGEQSEPRSAAEVAEALVKAHPDREIQTKVVRTTLENLVARNAAQRTKQGTSVFYTVPGSKEPTAAGADRAEPVAAG
ncbi:hypothetical protein [Streptomyces sp. NPDC096012]|uniref:hypothetical protein n=1 Tax=Streptomyces sp. NPDC096012 TaxID=3155684 RepID=UPI00336A3FEC